MFNVVALEVSWVAFGVVIGGPLLGCVRCILYYMGATDMSTMGKWEIVSIVLSSRGVVALRETVDQDQTELNKPSWGLPPQRIP